MRYKRIQDGLAYVMNQPYYDCQIFRFDFNIHSDNTYRFYKVHKFISENGLDYEIVIDSSYKEYLNRHIYELTYETVNETDEYLQVKTANAFKLYNTITVLFLKNLISIYKNTQDIPLLVIKGVSGLDESGERIIDTRKDRVAIWLMQKYLPVKNVSGDGYGNSIIELDESEFISKI